MWGDVFRPRRPSRVLPRRGGCHLPAATNSTFEHKPEFHSPSGRRSTAQQRQTRLTSHTRALVLNTRTVFRPDEQPRSFGGYSAPVSGAGGVVHQNRDDVRVRHWCPGVRAVRAVFGPILGEMLGVQQTAALVAAGAHSAAAAADAGNK